MLYKLRFCVIYRIVVRCYMVSYFNFCGKTTVDTCFVSNDEKRLSSFLFLPKDKYLRFVDNQCKASIWRDFE